MKPDTIAWADHLLEQRELALALSLFNHAEEEGADPDRCAAGRWMIFMLSGDFAAAWRESDGIRLRCIPDVHRFWHGEDLQGKCVMLRCLHGFGDSIQMLRFIPALKGLGVVRVIVECSPNAVGLVKCMRGIDEVITWGLEAPRIPPAFDVQMEVMELPYVLRATLSTLPAVGLLQLPREVLQKAGRAIEAISATPQVGIVWSAGDWNPSRSISLDLLRPILRNSRLHFWNLQGGRVREDWHGLPTSLHLHDAIEFTDAGLVPLAALMANLDLVITVDTLAAHLAGALGISCFLLLQYAADWRWMTDRTDSPWYPSLRLFRQPRHEDWQGAVSDINNALAAWAKTASSRRTAA